MLLLNFLVEKKAKIKKINIRDKSFQSNVAQRKPNRTKKTKERENAKVYWGDIAIMITIPSSNKNQYLVLLLASANSF